MVRINKIEKFQSQAKWFSKQLERKEANKQPAEESVR